MEGVSSEGTVELGTGESRFETMPSELQLYYGNQSGTFLIVHARIKGMEPGDATDFFGEGNPKTRFSAVLVDGEAMVRECPITLGYATSAEGWFELGRHDIVELFVGEEHDRLFDTDVLLSVEVIDSKGHYARDEKTVFARAPVEEIEDGGAGD